MQKYRKIKNPETHKNNRLDSKQFYLLSVDVGRFHDSTVCCVFRCNITSTKIYTTLVNLIVLGRTSETKTFHEQAVELKQIIQQFSPREVVMDTNGLGVGLADEMIHSQMGADGVTYPAYGFINDANYKKIQPKDCQQILYGIKANGPLNSAIHSNCYARINSGSCVFLIREQEAKSSLLATKVGQKMAVEQRVKRLMPHEMTTKLFDEMSNLRLKKTGSGTDIVLERINQRFPKDKYSAFSYGLWRVKEIEDEYFKRQQRGSTQKRQLVFYSGGK